MTVYVKNKIRQKKSLFFLPNHVTVIVVVKPLKNHITTQKKNSQITFNTLTFLVQVQVQSISMSLFLLYFKRQTF